MKENKVSIVLLSYNPIWEKMKNTLLSILMQENIEIELIIADDGSKKRYDEKIINLCEEHGLKNVKFSNLKENSGTCININEALKFVTTPYVKFISAGDYLFDKQICHLWVTFMNETKADITFGDAVYYCEEQKQPLVIQQKKAPVQEDLFNDRNRRGLFVDYLLANDTVLGATIMYKADVIKRYMKLFADKVKFAEDYTLRLAVFENKKVFHFSKSVIWYEFGTGISTSKKKKWQEMLSKDFLASNKILCNDCVAEDKIAQKYQKYLKNEGKNSVIRKIKKCLLFPDVIFWRYKNQRSINCTDTKVDIEKLSLYFDVNTVKDGNEV